MFNYDNIYEAIEKAIKVEEAKESAIIEELAYKRGYKAGVDSVTSPTEFLEEEKEEIYAEGYLEGIEDAWDAATTIIEMNLCDRAKRYGESKLDDIFKHNHPIDTIKDILIEEVKKAEEKPKKTFAEYVDELDIDDEAKSLLMDIYNGKA